MKRLNNITFAQFTDIQKNGYSLDMMYLLTLVEEEVDVKLICEDSPKLKAIYQSVYRKGLVTDENKLTNTSRELLKYFDNDSPVEKIVKKKIVEVDFDLWWRTYPGTDTFTYKGTFFSGSRSLRVKRDECKLKLHKILDEGEYTISDMVAALEYEVCQKKENSVKGKANKLSFMQNSLTYLNQRTFEPFIELIKEGVSVVETVVVTGGTDI